MKPASAWFMFPWVNKKTHIILVITENTCTVFMCVLFYYVSDWPQQEAQVTFCTFFFFFWPAGPCLSCQMSTAGVMSELFGWGHVQYTPFGYTGSSVLWLFISSDVCWPGWSTRSACSSVELRGFHSRTRSCGWLGEWPVDMVRVCLAALKTLNFLRRESHCLFSSFNSCLQGWLPTMSYPEFEL